jgi:hypothetical protein
MHGTVVKISTRFWVPRGINCLNPINEFHELVLCPSHDSVVGISNHVY